MDYYTFSLNFKLPNFENKNNIDTVIERLGDGGCTDALVCIGRRGYLLLDFERQSESPEAAIKSAIEDVSKIIQNSKLVEVNSDIVGVTDIAEKLNISRQYARHITLNKKYFPDPLHNGKTPIWNLYHVLTFLKHEGFSINEKEIETSKQAMLINKNIHIFQQAEIFQLPRAKKTTAKKIGVASIFSQNDTVNYLDEHGSDNHNPSKKQSCVSTNQLELA